MTKPSGEMRKPEPLPPRPFFGARLDVDDGRAGLAHGGDHGLGVGVEEFAVGGRVGRTAGGVAVGLAEDRVHRADYAHVG